MSWLPSKLRAFPCFVSCDRFFFVTIFICGIAFWFSNYIIPVANLKSRTLLADIVYAKPAFDLKEGVFYDKIGSFAIKIGKKESNDSIIRYVIVYEQTNPVQDNFIIAKSGIMRVSANKRYLEFNLRDGWRYEERTQSPYSNNTEYVRLGFKEYKKQFDLSSFQFVKTPDSVNKNNERVLSMRQLDKAIDSLGRENFAVRSQLQRNIYALLPFTKHIDSAWGSITITDTGARKMAKNFAEWLPDSARVPVTQKATAQVNSLRVSIESIALNLKEKERILRKKR